MSENSALYSCEKCMIYFYVFVSELGRWRNEDSCCLRCLIHFWLEDIIKQVTKWFVDWFDFTDIHVLWIHCICDVMVIALPLTYVGDRVIEPMSNQTKHYQIGICNFSIKSAPLISRIRFIVFNVTSKKYFSYIIIRSANTICIPWFSAKQAALRNVWLGTSTMCPSGASCLPADCSFIELALYKSK